MKRRRERRRDWYNLAGRKQKFHYGALKKANDAIACIKKGDGNTAVKNRDATARLRSRSEVAWRIKRQDQTAPGRDRPSTGAGIKELEVDPPRRIRGEIGARGTAMNHFRPTKDRERERGKGGEEEQRGTAQTK